MSPGAAARAAARWETTLFTARPAASTPPAAVQGPPPVTGIDARLDAARRRVVRVSARRAFQEALHGRGWIVDIRPEAQRRAEGEVAARPGALVVERNVLEWRFDPTHPARLPQAHPGVRLLVLCQEGYASSLAAESLLDLGLTRTADVVGGFAAWRDAGLPVRPAQAVHHGGVASVST